MINSEHVIINNSFFLVERRKRDFIKIITLLKS